MRSRRKTRHVTPILDGAVTEQAVELAEHPDARLTGGDVDADWRTAAANGEEAVGGSVATPDQDVVDELGEALGVARAPLEEDKSFVSVDGAQGGEQHHDARADEHAPCERRHGGRR